MKITDLKDLKLKDALDADLLQAVVLGLLKRKPTLQSKSDLHADTFVAPGQNSELHNGFVNCATNPVGLKATFHRLDDGAGAGLRWENGANGYDGYPGIVHGGILASLLDELMANALVATEDLFGVTTSARIQFLRVAKTGTPITGIGRVTKRLGRLRKCEATLYLPDGKAAATASAVFYLPTVAQFQKLAKVGDVPRDLHKHFFQGGERA